MIPHRCLKIDMGDLYAQHNDLMLVETKGKHRLTSRRHILKLAKPGLIGAEIGVFTGMFAEVLDRDLRPNTLYLVDPWEKLHGEFFPNWGNYSANQPLKAATAQKATEYRASLFIAKTEVYAGFLEDWAAKFSEPILDWAYLDASHEYGAVYRSLKLLGAMLQKNGIIFGDDCWIKPNGYKSDVFYAVRDFTKDHDYQYLRLDGHGQWAITRLNGDE